MEVPFEYQMPVLPQQPYDGMSELQKVQLEQLARAESYKAKMAEETMNKPKLETFMERLANQLPHLAEKVVRILPKQKETIEDLTQKFVQFRQQHHPRLSGSKIVKSDASEELTDLDVMKPKMTSERKSVLEMHTKDDINSKIDSNHDGPFTFIDNLPSPDTLFGFSNLFNKGNNNKVKKRDDGNQDKEVDLTRIEGIPIEKDEDEDVVTYEKPDEIVKPGVEKKVEVTTGSSVSEVAKSLISQFMKSGSGKETERGDSILNKKTTEGPPENIWAALLGGKLDKIDWISQLLGKESGDNSRGDGSEPTNPLAQLLKGGLFGSATSFDPKKPNTDIPFHRS
uniref:Uncharacterized protein n=1 Tax=Rhabditophanes sp. KR3021 TaxID=114890 RepID=A0AC35TQ76_9BILA